MNRRLAAALSLSLGGHAVLLAVIGLGLPQRPGTFYIDQRHPGILSASVSLQSPETVSPDAGNSIDPPLPEPAESVNSAGENATVVQDSSQAVEAGASKVSEVVEAAADGSAGEVGHTGMEAVGSLQAGNPAGPADTDPVLLSSLDPVYPMMARRAGLEGVVIIDVTVDCEGNPVEYRIQPPRCSKLLEESAVKAVMNSRFNPGTYRGTPVQDIFRIRVRFELDQS